MKLSKTEKIAIFAIPVAVGLYLIYRQLRNPRQTIQQKKTAITEIKNTPKVITNPTPSCSYPLKKGLYNCTVVKTLQKALNSYPEALISRSVPNQVLAPLVEDGNFGAKTEDYLMAVTSELAITKGSAKITYTWRQVDNEAAFNNLVDEINQAVLDALPYYPGVSAPQPTTPCNPLYEVCL